MPLRWHKAILGLLQSLNGAPELPNARQGPPKQYENLVTSMVLRRRRFAPEAVVLVDPLPRLGPLLIQTGAQWAPWQGRRSSKMGAKASHAAKP